MFRLMASPKPVASLWVDLSLNDLTLSLTNKKGPIPQFTSILPPS